MLGLGGLADLGFKGLCDAGNAAAELRDNRTAVQCFEAAAALRRSPYALGRLAAVVRDSGDLEGAIGHARAAIALDADQRWARTVLVAALCDLERWDAAESEGRAAHRRHPTEIPVLEVYLRAVEGQLAEFRANGFAQIAPESYEMLEREVRRTRRLLIACRERTPEEGARRAARRPLVYAEAAKRVGLAFGSPISLGDAAPVVSGADAPPNVAAPVVATGFGPAPGMLRANSRRATTSTRPA